MSGLIKGNEVHASKLENWKRLLHKIASNKGEVVKEKKYIKTCLKQGWIFCEWFQCLSVSLRVPMTVSYFH